ncbi:sensor histidine kinase [Marinitoga litoralis]|uniref:sensor histidine kinase n=1 Tax=Marinitoga litoralis TaxID=570855 RepID=UPI001961FD61|nr:HAMP domain-containing sensor histidine kinase [Marinitoga litoralis]MBM7560113.1 nitrogen fixation/metabolism regulation signal transduction histidine kinase [Marinitoga litoralis]
MPEKLAIYHTVFLAIIFWAFNLLTYWYILPISFFFMYIIVDIFVEKRLRRILHKGNAYNNFNYSLEYSGLFRELDEMLKTYSILLAKEREGLKEYYDKFNAIFDNIGSGILVFDNNGVLQRSNQEAKDIFSGIHIKYGMNISKILIKSGIKIPIQSGIYEVYSKKLRKNLQIIVTEQSNFIILAINDITNYVKLKRNLESARHFARLGEILANAAHGLKTPIARMKMVFQMYEMTQEKEYFDQIKQEIENIEKLIKETLELFKTVEEKKEFNLNILVDGIVSRFKETYPNIRFNVKNKCYVNIVSDEWLFKSAIMNIIQNSVDAMRKENNPGCVYISFLEKKKYYKIMFFDNGIGMDKTEKEKYLKPFFTTKENGTGLGTVFLEKLIIMENAKLRINSIKNKGTIISILLNK